MEYKDFVLNVFKDDENGDIYYGRVDIPDSRGIMIVEGPTLKRLVDNFKESVDEFLDN